MESNRISYMSCIEPYHQAIVTVTDLSELMPALFEMYGASIFGGSTPPPG